MEWNGCMHGLNWNGHTHKTGIVALSTIVSTRGFAGVSIWAIVGCRYNNYKHVK